MGKEQLLKTLVEERIKMVQRMRRAYIEITGRALLSFNRDKNRPFDKLERILAQRSNRASEKLLNLMAEYCDKEEMEEVIGLYTEYAELCGYCDALSKSIAEVKKAW